jgi:hypothetical protein
MGATTTGGIWTPDESETGKANVYLATMAQSIDDTGVLKPAFRNLKLAAQTTLGNAAYAKITNWTSDVGDQNSSTVMTYSSGDITCTVSGLYRVDTQVGFAGNLNGARYIRPNINGVAYRTSMSANGGGLSTVGQSRTYYVPAGGKIYLEAYQASGGNLDIVNGDYTYLTVTFVGKV